MDANRHWTKPRATATLSLTVVAAALAQGGLGPSDPADDGDDQLPYIEFSFSGDSGGANQPAQIINGPVSFTLTSIISHYNQNGEFTGQTSRTASSASGKTNFCNGQNASTWLGCGGNNRTTVEPPNQLQELAAAYYRDTDETNCIGTGSPSWSEVDGSACPCDNGQTGGAAPQACP